MLTTERDQVPHGRKVAALHIRAEELPSLAETQRVDGRGGAQDVIARQLLADLLDLFRQVSKEGGGAVRVSRVAELDDANVGAGIDRLGQLTGLFDTVCIV